MDAYQMLLEYQKHEYVEFLTNYSKRYFADIYDIVEVRGKKLSDQLENKFILTHFRTSNCFIQIQINNKRRTFIANLGLLRPINLDPKSQNEMAHLRNSLSSKNIQVYAIPQNKNTFCVSFIPEVNCWSFSSGKNSILAQKLQDIHVSFPPFYDRVLKGAEMFLSLSNEKLDALSKDLISRSLVGYVKSQKLVWFQIVEHYGANSLPFDEVEEFLKHYQLEMSPYEYLGQYDNLQNIYDALYDKPVDALVEGTSVYFFMDRKCIQCCFVQHKYHQIYSELRTQLKDNKIDFKYLEQFKLSKHETTLIKKVSDILVNYKQKFGDEFLKGIKYSHAVLSAYNYIKEGISQMKDHDFYKHTLRSCLGLNKFLLIPIGLEWMGYKEIFKELQQKYEGFDITMQYERSQQPFILYDKALSVQDSDALINKIKLNTPHIKTIALLPKQNRQYISNGVSYPFSFNFILKCLKNSASIEREINQLKTFENMKQIVSTADMSIEVDFLITSKEDIYDNIVETDLESALQGTQFDSLKESVTHQLLQSTPQEHFYDQAEYLAKDIISQTGVRLRRKQIQFEKRKVLGLSVKNPNWVDINNSVIDAMELIVDYLQQNKKDFQKANQMFDDLKKQLFHGGQTIYNRAKELYLNTQKDFMDKEYDITANIIIVVIDGLISLHTSQDFVQDAIDTYDIPVYHNNLDIERSCKVTKQLQTQIFHFKKKPSESVHETHAEINQKQWKVFFVKIDDINLKLLIFYLIPLLMEINQPIININRLRQYFLQLIVTKSISNKYEILIKQSLKFIQLLTQDLSHLDSQTLGKKATMPSILNVKGSLFICEISTVIDEYYLINTASQNFIDI
ncbi:hypothetical protein pb186bvf_017724 [Paramecium bursaria]